MMDEFVLKIIAKGKVGEMVGEMGKERKRERLEKEEATGRCVAVQYSLTRGVEMILSACRNCRGTGVF